MTIKNEMKMGLLHEQGVKAEDMLESAVKRQATHDGAKQALRQIAKNMAALAAAVDKDMDEGKLPLEEPAKVASYVKLMIDRCAQMAMTAGQHQENLQMTVSGEIIAYRSIVDGLKKEIMTEQSKLQALKQAVASGEIRIEDDSAEMAQSDESLSRPAGVRPAMGIAAQRRAEEMMESTESTVDGGQVEASAPGRANGKRGGRKKAD